ncbi:MAG TPA: PEP-CTERM sorting domain-containing protein [Bryobacteraceae bacterium]
MSRLLFASILTACVSITQAGTIDLNGSITGIFQGGRPTMIAATPGDNFAIATTPGDNFAEGDPYTMHLGFDGSFSGPGDYTLTNLTLVFDGGTEQAFQNHFDSAAVSISDMDTGQLFTLTACASIKDPCFDGNRLDVDFIIPAASTVFDSFKPDGFPDVPAMQLQEGSAGITFSGTIDNFMYSSAVITAPAPEPASLALAALGSLALILTRRRRATI